MQDGRFSFLEPASGVGLDLGGGTSPPHFGDGAPKDGHGPGSVWTIGTGDELHAGHLVSDEHAQGGRKRAGERERAITATAEHLDR